jgi:lysophospholipase L1-like esterase
MSTIRLFVCLLLALAGFAQNGFYLKPGDRVVFYGDSITDQRLYTTFVETFVRTRFPALDATFTHSGWGGDRVTGGGGGVIDLRLKRDVGPYAPTVVTIMLGMNDGRYRPFDKDIFDDYSAGYESMVKQIKALAPKTRITLIRPSPYDDVTKAPMNGGGYNAVLVRFGDFLAQLAAREGLDVADMNAPVVEMLKKAHAANAEVAGRIVPDRVHPGAAGHLIMAAALLKAWAAPAVVSNVDIDAGAARVLGADNTAVRSLVAGPVVSWQQSDKCLPMPVDMNDPVTSLAVKSSDFLETLNSETLKVRGLKPGHYALRIDAQQVAVFTADQLAAGINLAVWPTPMAKQAAEVHTLTRKRTDVHQARWRTLEVPLANDQAAATAPAIEALDALDRELAARQRAAAIPYERRYELVAVPPEAANVPPGFTPIFNGRDLAGWHVSKTNHHGTTPDWRAENGVLSGGQNPVGKGGIMLTDKKYKNFEVYAEINPDWGCDGGLFLRSTDKGEAYQVLLDFRENGTLFGVYGEALKGVRTFSIPEWRKNWKENDWNSVRARIEGDIPHITVWANGVRVTDWWDSANHLPEGAVDGMIAVQVHGGTQIWKEGGHQRFRNVAIRELP